MTAPKLRADRRVSTTFTDDDLDAIDSWGFSKRIRDRSEAIRQLVGYGLETSAATSPSATTAGQ